MATPLVRPEMAMGLEINVALLWTPFDEAATEVSGTKCVVPGAAPPPTPALTGKGGACGMVRIFGAP